MVETVINPFCSSVMLHNLYFEPQWRDELSTFDEQTQFKNIPKRIKIRWVGAIRRYSYVDDTPREWLDILLQYRRLEGSEMSIELLNY